MTNGANTAGSLSSASLRPLTSASPPTKQRRHIGALDGLRGVAAIAVFFGHFGVHVGRGVELGALSEFFELAAHGLTLFFVLSGFLLYLPFASHLMGKKPFPSMRAYAAARIWRIYPAFVAIWLIAQASGLLYTRTLSKGETLQDISVTVGQISDPWQILTNLMLIHSYIPDFVKTGIGPSWSLTVEMTFYVLLPGVVWVLAKVATALGVSEGIRRATFPVIALFLLGVAGRLGYAYVTGLTPDARVYDLTLGSTWEAVLYLSFLTRADLFAAGMAAALAYVVLRDKSWSVTAKRTVATCAVGVVAVGLLAYYVTRLDPFMGLVFAVGIFLLAVPAVAFGVTYMSRILAVAPAQYLGRLSYSLYLWHGPALWVTFWAVGENVRPTMFFLSLAITTACVLLLSAVTYHLIEKPSMAWGKRLAKSGAVTASRT